MREYGSVLSNNKGKRGASLVEVTISIFIVAILMTVIADLVTRYSMILRYQEKKDRALANMKMALDTIASEIEEALGVYDPDVDGVIATSITFYRYNPEQTGKKFDNNRTGVYIKYFLDNKTLYREILAFEGRFTCPIAHEVSGFSVKRENQRLYTISVSIEEAKRVYSVDAKACLKTGI